MDDDGMNTEIHLASGKSFRVAEERPSVEDIITTATLRVVTFEGPGALVYYIAPEHVEAFHEI